jgi:hypothetical protein
LELSVSSPLEATLLLVLDLHADMEKTIATHIPNIKSFFLITSFPFRFLNVSVG